MGRLLVIAAISAVLLCAQAARADVALIYIEGVASKRFERDLANALPDGVESKPSRTAAASLKAALRKTPLSKLEEAPPNDAGLVKAVRRALKASKHDLAILVAVGKKRDIHLLIVPIDERESAFFRTTTLPRFESPEEHVKWWADLFEEATRESKAPEPEPEAEAETKPASETPEEKPREEPAPKKEREEPPQNEGRANYFLALGADTGLRRFADNEAGTGSARTYRAFPIFGFHVGAELYPVLDGQLGLEAGYGMSLGIQSKSSDGQTLSTTWLRADGALKFRVFTADRAQSPWLAVLLGYGYSRFAFDGPPPNREVPTGVYEILRAGLDGRAPIDRVVLSLGGEYDRLMSIEPLGNVTTAPSGDGFTVRAGIGLEVVSRFQLRVEGRYTWLLFSIVRDIPSNVVDQYLTGSLTGELAF